MHDALFVQVVKCEENLPDNHCSLDIKELSLLIFEK